MENNTYIKNIVVVALKLLLICAVIAGVVSFVYTATLDAYNKNIERETLQSMATIFGAGESDEISLETFAADPDSSVKEIYGVKVNGESVGYCLKVIAKGFGGDMSLMVGYHPDKTIRGVSIVSHAETPGVGSKVDDATYLSQYEGLSGGLTISKRGDADITSVSGATISSKAIHMAIEQASAALALVQ